jgi:hypothetical protein
MRGAHQTNIIMMTIIYRSALPSHMALTIYTDTLNSFYPNYTRIKFFIDPLDKEDATDATLATHNKNGVQLNSVIDEGDDDRLFSDSTPSSVNVEHQSGAEAIATQIEPILLTTKK